MQDTPGPGSLEETADTAGWVRVVRRKQPILPTGYGQSGGNGANIAGCYRNACPAAIILNMVSKTLSEYLSYPYYSLFYYLGNHL